MRAHYLNKWTVCDLDKTRQTRRSNRQKRPQNGQMCRQKSKGDIANQKGSLKGTSLITADVWGIWGGFDSWSGGLFTWEI